MSKPKENEKWFLNHPNGEVYSFYKYGKESDGYSVQIKHNGKNAQEVIPDKHHSDGCYHLNVARKQWDALISQGFEINERL